MAYFEKNFMAGDEPGNNLDRVMSAVGSVVSNTVFDAEHKQDEKCDKTSCMALYTLIGCCEAMLAQYTEASRDKALEECAEFFSGEFMEKRRAKAEKFVSDILRGIFG